MSALPSQPRIRIPRSARAGEVIEIRTLIEHPALTHEGNPHQKYKNHNTN